MVINLQRGVGLCGLLVVMWDRGYVPVWGVWSSGWWDRLCVLVAQYGVCVLVCDVAISEAGRSRQCVYM